MKHKIYKANERGTADHGWLKANFSFSFAHYYNPENINFGALRVLNDDIITGGMGFGTHPHDNMEIISIPLKGALKHRDSMSNTWIPLHTGEVQVMSAGTGIQHSEMNNHPAEEVNLFQIWIMPKEYNIAPRYDQKTFEVSQRLNKLQTLVSSIENPVEGSLTINQNAKISRIDLDENTTFNYQLMTETNGVYVMVINGELSINNIQLEKRDAIGIEQTNLFQISSTKKSEVLFIEVPMKF
ncbi:MAG: pirin family protein [Lutibacter sp.]|uniref:pirin family protein n=1 Tax=Lutibacter sp. TaxID=1925666 RepID=UPI0017C9B6A8|nr:pirin family protein [Lutibacter sp.]MBT8316315.1 pirin family protein [Lutibacter sp.]NNJ57175.1 pirin family protein [Lutibacter sp.]